MSTTPETRETISLIVARTDPDSFIESVLDSFWELPDHERLHPPRDQVREWVRWNLALIIRWLVEGEPPGEADLARLRDRAQARAVDGMAVEVILANFRRAARFAWGALLQLASEAERPALLSSAGVIFEYLDLVATTFTETYRDTIGSTHPRPEDRAAAQLLRRYSREEELQADDRQVAERIGFDLLAVHRPFAVALPGLSVDRHVQLSTRLRGRRMLATAEGRRVIGLCNGRVDWREVDLHPGAILCEGDLSPRAHLWDILDELRATVELAERDGRTGSVTMDDYLPELLLRRNPRLAGRIAARVYASLDAELARTLDLLIEHRFDRGATANLLPVHRNTLNNRVKRIQEITGVDIESPRGRALVWLAWRQRREDAPQDATVAVG